MVKKLLERMLVMAALSSSACTPAQTTGNATCGLSAGRVDGNPRMTMGTGAQQYIARNNGDRWLANFGQQGGAHLWLAFESAGIGPQVDVSYRMSELDGGAIYTGSPVPVCLSAAENGGQMSAGLMGFIDYTFPEPCSRILCGPPFKVSITVSDDNGHSLSDERLVNGVDIGDDLDSTSLPDCAGANYDPKPTCENGLQ